MIIDVAEMTPGRFSARIGARVLVQSSRQPLFDAARVLLAQGSNPSDTLTMRRENGTESLRATIGEAAALTVDERPAGDRQPRFAPYREIGVAARHGEPQD